MLEKKTSWIWVGLIILVVGSIGGYFQYYVRLHKLQVPGFTYLGMGVYQSGGITHKVFEYRHDQTGLEFSLLPGGNFSMGNSSVPSESPVHEVKIKPFFISKTKVTRQVWKKIMGTEPWKSGNKGEEELPVTSITWHEAKMFCQKTGLLLPTEAQWEYACRGGSLKKYFWGDSLEEGKIHSWFDGKSIYSEVQKVGQKKPNSYGLFDMCDNGLEWCEDWYYPGYPSSKKESSEEEKKNDSLKSVRSSFCKSLAEAPAMMRSSYRRGISSQEKDPVLSFRCAFIYERKFREENQ